MVNKFQQTYWGNKMHRIGMVVLFLIMLNGCVGVDKELPRHPIASDRMHSGSTISFERKTQQMNEIDSLLVKDSITLSDLLKIAELNNPELAGARDLIDAAQGHFMQAEVYPNPTLGLEVEDAPASNISLNKSTNKISITQPIILGNRRSAAISSSKIKIDSRRLILENQRRDLVGGIYEIYAELVYLNQAEILYDQLLEIARQTLSIATTRLEARAVLEAEVIKSQIEVHELELGKRRLSYQRIAMVEKLQAVLGNKDIAANRIEGELSTRLPDIDLSQLKAEVKKSHPSILAGQKNIKAYGYRIKQAEEERIPDLNLKVAYGRDEVAEENIVEAGIGFTLPFFDNNKGNIRVARSLKRKAIHDLEGITGRLLTDLASSHSFYMTSKSEVEVFKERIVPASEKSLAQIQEAYKAGRMKLLDLLDAQRTHARAKLSLLESLKNINIAKSKIWKITGKFDEDKND